jgi:hypothetical protein
MSAHPELMAQIARQHQHAMMAEAGQRQLRRQARQASQDGPVRSATAPRHPAPRQPTLAGRLVAAMAKLGVTSARVPHAS